MQKTLFVSVVVVCSVLYVHGVRAMGECAMRMNDNHNDDCCHEYSVDDTYIDNGYAMY